MPEGSSSSSSSPSPPHKAKAKAEAKAKTVDDSDDVHDQRRHTTRIVLLTLLAVLLLAGIVALVLYLVYRPSKPRFSAVSAAILDLTPAPVAVSAALQFTLLAHNPNTRSSLHYERLRVHAAYRGFPVTQPAAMPPLRQGRASTVTMSLFAGGGAYVGMPAEVARVLKAEAAAGAVGLTAVVTGRLRYEPGPFHSGWRSVVVTCDVVAAYGRAYGGHLPMFGQPSCHVHV